MDISEHNQEPDDLCGLPVSNSIDNAILMHRDAHFSGQFDVMLDYYEREGKGALPDFSLEKIRELAEFERQAGQNLSGMLLSGPEAEKVAEAKEAYKKLRDLYEQPKSGHKHPLLIADLILSEEEEPEQEIEAIVKEKSAIVPVLIDLLRSQEWYDPLFPGYGTAPFLAAKCLARIGDKRAIYSLFEVIGEGDFFNEDAILDALGLIGEPAKEFLRKVVHSRPINADNERAAIALIRFKNDPEVAKECFHLLEDPTVRKQVPLANYLSLVCEGLPAKDYREKLLKLAEDAHTPSIVRQDLKAVAKLMQQ